MVNEPTANLLETDCFESRMTRSTPFAYSCSACSRCCQHYLIRVNPFETLMLARHLSMTTTEFIGRYVDPGPSLKHRQSGFCMFLGEQGCTVHAARPLACRLYPLGRHVSGQGEEHFFRMKPHPETEGRYSDTGTVEDYLKAQGALAFIDATDRYLVLFHRLYQALAQTQPGRIEEETSQDMQADSGEGRTVPDLLDLEQGIAMMFAGRSVASLDPVEAMSVHIQALEAWLFQTHQESLDE